MMMMMMMMMIPQILRISYVFQDGWMVKKNPSHVMRFLASFNLPSPTDDQDSLSRRPL